MANTIQIISKYERKILMRSWFFRIFAALSMLVLFVFNMEGVSEVGSHHRVYGAVSSAIPYLEIFILNIAQAIVAVFLSSEFIKRDRKQDTTEVFYVRSMSNGAYVLGKVWSIFSIFILINIAALTLGLIFNLVTPGLLVDWKAYLYYPLLISLPTLIFIIGLSCLLMTIIRNQALTFVLLLGYILTSLIYIRGTYDYLFDYMAFYLPLFHSDITGFGDWPMILRLRGMYACFGMGFLFFTILFLKRLPQVRWMKMGSLILGIGFIAFAIYLGLQHYTAYQERIALPQQMIALNNQFIDAPRIDIEKHEINFDQKEYSYAATSLIQGLAEEEAKEFVFMLNPGLAVHSVESNGASLSFNRELHLLFVQWDTVISKEQPLSLSINYEGSINEHACFIDIDEKTRSQRNRDRSPFSIGKRYAYNQPEYLLLTPESNWYPTSGVGYSDQDPTWYRKDFVKYQLSVETLPGLKPVSASTVDSLGNNKYAFAFDFPLPQLALAIGNYEKQSIQTEDIEFSVEYIKGHDYFTTAFPDIRDTLSSMIRERLGDFERRVGIKYPFKTFRLVEVPGQFKSYDRNWTSIHETGQPGFLFIPEKGLYSRSYDFNWQVKRRKRWRRNRDKSPEELQIQVFTNFLNEFYDFKDVDIRGNANNVVEQINPYYVFVQFYEMTNNLDSREWPVLNRIFESYLRTDEDGNQDWIRRSSGSTQYEQANMILQEQTFSEVLTSKENQALIDNVIELKGATLFSMMEAKANTGRFREFIIEILEQHQFSNLPFEAFQAQLQEAFGVDLSGDMAKWFNATEMPQYLLSTPIAEEVLVGDKELVGIGFRASNLGNVEGVIKVTIQAEEASDRLLYLDKGQTKDVYYLSALPPNNITFNTLVSGNLPNRIVYNFEGINKGETKKSGEKQAIIDQDIILENEREIIVDNESEGFVYSQFVEVSRLRKWLKVADAQGRKYKGVKVWRPPLNWTAATNDQFFGKFVRSAFYIKTGDGAKEAQWNIPVKSPGRYDVYYHVYKDESFNWDRNMRGKYQFSIPHKDGTDYPTIELGHNSPGGWTSLGDYYFPSDTVTISLSNESRLRAIFADAVKLVKMD